MTSIQYDYQINEELTYPHEQILYFNSYDNKFLITAPHHATNSNDIRGMYTLRGTIRTYDANTGYIALSIAESLDASYLIYNNAKEDPNKDSSNNYCQIVKRKKPQILVEIHGHSEKSIDRSLIEVSGGLNNNEMSIKFAQILKKELNETDLSYINVEGDFNKIYYKASKTATVNGLVWNNDNGKTLHIELPKHLRSLENVSKIATIITKTLKQI